jgi:hypothetical protein
MADPYATIADADPTLQERLSYILELRPRKANHGVDLISDALPFGRPCYHEPENSR